MKFRTKIVFGIAALLFSVASLVRGAGITIITHGYAGNVDGWVNGMALQIPNYPTFPGTNSTTYKLTLLYNGSSYSYQWSRLRGTLPTAADSGEIIVELDWSDEAGGLSTNYDESTYDVAQAATSALLLTNGISEMGGHPLVEFPLHLIGHSRGGSLVCEISRLLGGQGLWVDHLTTLDPHPFNNDGNSEPSFPFDASAYPTYLTVLYRDNYWQNMGSFPDQHGEPVSGAYNRQLYNLSGGYNNTNSISPYHSNVHLWYHGTVDQASPACDTEACITSAEFNNWYVAYENFGDNAGFIYSLIGGGDRTSPNQPVGAGYPAIRDGYNQAWDLGAGVSGNRTSLPSDNGSWPNIIKFNVLGTNTVSFGSAVSNKYFFQYGQSPAQTATVQMFLDTDSNPYNGNSGQVFQLTETGTGTNIMRWRTNSFSATNAPGLYRLYAKVTDGTRTRYLYAPGTLTIVDRTSPTVSLTNTAKTFTNSQTVTISANATDNVGVTSVAFYDNGVLKGTDTAAPYTYDWSFTGANNGTHSWTARAYDASGNVAISSVVVLTVSIVDTTPPIVAITSPTNGQNVAAATITVSGTATDPGSSSSGLAAVEVRVNGGGWSSATGTTNWTRSVTLTNCGNTLEARSRDNATNYSTIVSNFVFYTPPDTVPNTPTNLSPINGARNVTVTPTLQASAFSDPDPPCLGDTHGASQWQVLSPAALVVADSGTDTVDKLSWTVPAGQLYYGSNYQWQVRYRDSRGGWSSYSTRTFFTNGGPSLIVSKQGTNVVLNWPTNSVSFTLQWSTNLGVSIWSNATPPGPAIVNGKYAVTNNTLNTFRFYRLKK